MRIHVVSLAFLVACNPDSKGSGDTDTGTGTDTSTSTDADTGTDTGTAVDCSGRPIALPSARGELRGVWDSERDRFVFFAGDHGVPIQCIPETNIVGDTWAFHTDCDNFEQIEAATAPPARARFAAGHDEARGRMIVYGGRWREATSGAYTLRDDTWAFDLATDTWSEIPGNGPPARNVTAGAVSGDTFVVFGGSDSDSGLDYAPMDDTWVLDLTTDTWSQLATTGAIDARLFHAMAGGDGKVWAYSGGDENSLLGPFFKDLWELDLATATWTELHDGSSGAPGGRIWPDLMYDAANNRLVSWAGHNDVQMIAPTNELLAFDLGSNTWSALVVGDTYNNPAGGFCDFPVDFTNVDFESPERRYGAATALTDDGQIITFGGKTDCGIIDDLWTHDLSTGEWTQRSSATKGESCVRAYQECQQLCF